MFAEDIQNERTQSDFAIKAMKFFIFLMVGSFAHTNQAGSVTSQTSDISYSRIRHWAMPNYRQMGNNKVVNPTYNRLSHRSSQDLKMVLESMDAQGSRTSSIWHSYTQNLF